MSTEPLKNAIAATRGVLENVSAEQMQAPTPCASWDVAGLINHIVGGQHFFAAGVRGEQPGEAPNATDGDILAAYDEATSAFVAALEAPGALDQIVKMPFGEMPAQAVMGLGMTDTFQHGWDLAKATGQSTDIAPELAAQLLAQSKAAISENFRGPEGAPFGAEKACPEGASNADQLAAFLGREV